MQSNSMLQLPIARAFDSTSSRQDHGNPWGREHGPLRQSLRSTPALEVDTWPKKRVLWCKPQSLSITGFFPQHVKCYAVTLFYIADINLAHDKRFAMVHEKKRMQNKIPQTCNLFQVIKILPWSKSKTAGATGVTSCLTASSYVCTKIIRPNVSPQLSKINSIKSITWQLSL